MNKEINKLKEEFKVYKKDVQAFVDYQMKELREILREFPLIFKKDITELKEKIEKIDKIILLDKEIAEKECAETIIECIISQCDSNKDRIEKLEDK